MSVHIPNSNRGHSPSPWTPVRAAIGTLVTAVVVFGLAFQFVSSVIFIAAGALALGAAAGVFGARRALRSSLSRDAVPPPLAAFGVMLVIAGTTLGGLGSLRFVTVPSSPARIAGVPNPFASASSTPIGTAAPTPTSAPTDTAPTPTPSPGSSPVSSPTAAAIGSTRLPYTADWSKGLNQWAVSPNWQLVDGVLTNNGQSNDDTISATAPVSLGSVRDYVVEADIELVRYTGGYDSFGFVIRSVDDKTGYRVGHCDSNGGQCDYNSPNYSAGIWDVGTRRVLAYADLKPPPQSWHHYRVEVKATTITFTAPDLGVNLTTTDNAYLVGTQVGLWSRGCQISVKNFTVSAAP